MVNFYTLLLGWFRLIPWFLYLLSGFGLLWTPLFALQYLAFISAIIWILLYKEAKKHALESEPILDFIFDKYIKFLEKENSRV